MKAEGLLRAEGLSLRLGGHRVLHAANASFARGWTAIVGPNGAGKSSLLRVLAGLRKPDAGVVSLDSACVNAADKRPALAPGTRAQRIAWLSQTPETTGDLTVRETVALGRLPHRGLSGAWRPGDEHAIDEALMLAGCAGWQHRRLPSLSGGERQRALLARALATGAQVLLLDEPTTHLDPPHQVALAHLTRRLGQHRTVVTVLHDLALALAADRILLLVEGHTVAQGAASDATLHRAIEAAFGQAVLIEARPGEIPLLRPRW